MNTTTNFRTEMSDALIDGWISRAERHEADLIDLQQRVDAARDLLAHAEMMAAGNCPHESCTGEVIFERHDGTASVIAWVCDDCDCATSVSVEVQTDNGRVNVLGRPTMDLMVDQIPAKLLLG